MKRLLLFMIYIISNQANFSADSAKKVPGLTASQALYKLWNEDTGKVSANFIETEHQRQEARENPFYCDLSPCDRRDVRRAMIVLTAASVVGAATMPHLAVPILGFGGISTAALGAQLVMHKAPYDQRKSKKE